MECVRALRVIKVPIEHWDHILVFFTVKKLDSNTRREWAVKLTGTTSPSFKELTDFLENHIRGLLASGASNQKPTSRNNRPHVATHHSSSEKCPLCSADHFMQRCEAFVSKSPAERSTLVKQHNRCFNCLRKDHRINDCKSHSRCRKCSKKHHTFLHVDRSGDGQPKLPPPPPAADDKTPGVSSHHAHSSHQDTQVLLSTAVVKVKSRSSGDQYVRVLFDSGSEGTFITEECVRLLGLKRHASSIQVKGVSSMTIGTTRGLVNCTLFSRLTNNSFTIAAHILPKVTGYLPRQTCSPVWPHLQGLELADPKFHEPGAVDILLGADYSAAIMMQAKVVGPINSPIAQESMFGWVLTGRVTISDPILQSHHVEMEVDAILQRFWTVEEPPQTKLLTQDEKECESIFTQHVTRNNEGRYIVPIPFNGKQTQLGSSRSTAVRRFLQVERRLNRNEDYHKQYTEFMNEYLSLGHMERIPDDEAKEEVGSTYYLPHHFVLNQSSSTTKFRVVFDGSAATTTGLSLNDAMFVGATVQDDLYSLLLRFRTHTIVLKADIAKMFRQFRLKKEDADYHRIVWRNSPTEPMADYRLQTVTYGTACAPFLSTRSLHELAKDCKFTFPTASKVIDDDIYVDDVLTGTSTAEAGIKLYRELSDAAASAKLELRKWASNDATVLEAIPEHLRETDPLKFDKQDAIKALGVQWNPSQDSFSFSKIDMRKCDVLTKRILLSDLARVFDPLGFLAAVTIRAKLIMQELWKLSIGWDEALPLEFQQQWREYCSEIENIPNVVIPRCITTTTALHYELHGFSDASEKAYGGIIYLRVVNIDGTIRVSFVTSKAKVAPMKQLTLARLELCGALVLSNLIVAVKQALKLSCDVFSWCDSTIVLRWIAANPLRWQTFVANRVAQLQDKVPVECWRHVPGIENPADLVSRGITVDQLINNKFLWTGPNWLSQQYLPLFTPAPLPQECELEERKLKLQPNHCEFTMSLLERFSSLPKLKRVTAYILQFYNNGKTKSQQHNDEITDNLTSPGIPSAPHHRGLWEAAVKSSKFYLRRIMNNSILIFEQFQTVLCQVEAVLNSRPLCAPSSDPSGLHPLTPGHFLIGEALLAVPDEALDGLKENRLGVLATAAAQTSAFLETMEYGVFNHFTATAEVEERAAQLG
ncbi:unnamed protein product [Orchesella dallaii]|uniref:Peptidase aspartic putative domain-containing protein n=1 Tax=Orchesella dallaii TaxID=48710 RepID=A0ABP1QWE8_9HEXA